MIRWPSAGVVAAVLALSACAGSGTDKPVGTEEETGPVTSSTVPVRQEPSVPAQSLSQNEVMSAEETLRQEKLAAITGNPDQFLDMEPKGLAAALGAPRQIRRDGTAEVWQFVGDGCTVDIFLYPGNAGGSPRVTFVDLRGDGLTTAGRQACLAALQREQIIRSS